MRVGSGTGSTKLCWIADLLDDAEVTALQIAPRERRPFEITARQGHAAMIIVAWHETLSLSETRQAASARVAYWSHDYKSTQTHPGEGMRW